jgi:hypothetical protein
VDRYLDQAVTQGTAPFYPVPPFLANALREGTPWALNQSGITRAYESAQSMRGADSAGRTGPPTGLKPAPGPAPVAPGDSKRSPP